MIPVERIPGLTQPMHSPVDHPPHYTAYEGLEVIDLTEQMNFNRGNAVKYVARAGLKDPSREVEDLRKAIWYLNREIGRLEREKLEAEMAKSGQIK